MRKYQCRISGKPALGTTPLSTATTRLLFSDDFQFRKLGLI